MGVKRIPVGGYPVEKNRQDIGWREIRHDAPLTSGKQSGIRSVGFTDTYKGNLRQVGSPAGTNKIVEYVEDWITSFTNYVGGDALNGKGLFDLPFYYSMLMNSYTEAGPSVGERYMGIEWGSFQQAPPWGTSYAISVGGGVLQFRWNYTLDRWEVLAWAGDNSVPPDIIPTTINPTFSADLYNCEIAMEYTPATHVDGVVANSKLVCYHEGISILTLENHPSINALLNTGQNYGAGYFATSGSDAGASFGDAIFMTNKIYQRRPKLGEDLSNL